MTISQLGIFGVHDHRYTTHDLFEALADGSSPDVDVEKGGSGSGKGKYPRDHPFQWQAMQFGGVATDKSFKRVGRQGHNYCL